MTLDHYILPKEIMIDAFGWSDLLLGVVIGALKPPDPMLMDRRIPTLSFQSPNFENRKYLIDAIKIVDEIIEVMKPDKETHFRVCSGYILSSVRAHLKNKGYRVEKMETSIQLQEMVERSYIRWCIQVGVPEEIFLEKLRFWPLLEWVAEKPHLRERLVKTGWKSWKKKWREEVYKKKQKF